MTAWGKFWLWSWHHSH